MNHRFRSARRRLLLGGGFTLLEILIVVSLIGILAAVAIPRLGSYGNASLPTQAQAFADVVRRAQSLAVSRQSLTRVSLTSGANGSVSIATCAAVASCVNHSSYTLSQNVSVGSGSSIYFNSLGTPVDSAGIPLTNSVSYAIAFGGSSLNVSVAVLTGRVSVGP